MVAAPGTLQASFNSGEIAEELWKRNDVKQFYAAASFMQNVEAVPQGGFRGLDRSRDLGPERGLLNDLGGIRQDFAGPHYGVAVVSQLTFPGSRPVAGLRAGLVSTKRADAAIRVEYRTDGNWTPLGPDVGMATARRGFVVARPPGQPVTADAVRILYLGAAAPAEFSLLEIFAFSELENAPAEVQYVPFTVRFDRAYMCLVSSSGLADVYKDGVWVGAAWHGLTVDLAIEAVPVQRLETLLLFHDDHPTIRITSTSDAEWLDALAPFQDVPRVDLGGDYAKVDEVWQIAIRWPTSEDPTGYALTVAVDGEETPVMYVQSGPNWSALCAEIRARVEALATVASNIVVSDEAGAPGLRLINITFSGAGNSGSQFAVSARIVNNASGGAAAIRAVKGDAGGEALWSPDRGYATAGIFYQDRLVQGGFRSKMGGMLASPTGDYFSGNIENQAASGAILINLDTDGAERIQRFARSRHLVIFTSDAEYYVSDRVLQRTQVPTIVESSRNGSAATVPICSTETSLLYLSRARSLIYSAAYDDVAQAYVSTPLTLLAKHLIKTIRAAALQRADDKNDAARYFLVRDDGLMLAGLIIQSQEVTAFVRWQTDGFVRRVAVDGANRVYLSVERIVAGVPRRRVEWLEPGLLVDGAVTKTFSSPQTVVSGLGMHEGATVWAIADGWTLGPFTVADGAIALPNAVSTVTVGRWTPPLVRTLPLPRDIGNRVVLERPCRVHTVKLRVKDTTSIAIGANGETPEDVPLYSAGMPTDAPQVPVSGWLDCEGLEGWSDDGLVTLTQMRPGLMHVVAVNIQAKT